MTDDLDQIEDLNLKRTIDELDTMWDQLAKVEIIAIKAASEAREMSARLRSYEQKLFRVEGENEDLRKILARLQSQTEEQAQE